MLKNKIDYILSILIVFTVLGFYINLNKTFDDELISIKVDNSYSNKILENSIYDMLNHNKKLLDTVRNLPVNNDFLFYIYSKEECSSCTDTALRDLYEIAKNIKNVNRIVVITPESDKKQIEYLSGRYDNLLIFVSGEGIWNNYKSKLNNITSLFFISNSRLYITGTYVFDVDDNIKNQLYYNHVIKKLNKKIKYK